MNFDPQGESRLLSTWKSFRQAQRGAFGLAEWSRLVADFHELRQDFRGASCKGQSAEIQGAEQTLSAPAIKVASSCLIPPRV